MSELPARRPLVVVANRLPVSRNDDGSWQASAGGLVTALRPVTSEVDALWVGWDGAQSGVPRRVEGFDVDLSPLALDEQDVQGYYYGFSNRTLWPLFHDMVVQPVIEREWWRTYQEVNHAFAEATADAVKAAEYETPPLLWVQDYHLMLLPDLLRGMLPDSPIAFFLHIPFPPPELMARIPWRNEILRGLLGADLVTFHTERYRQNFIRSCERVLSDAIQHNGETIWLQDGREVRTAAHAISIDADEFSELAVSPETEKELASLRQQFEGRKVFLGVDRLDYTKGIRHRLQAIESLLERNEQLRREFAFVQVAVPSRDDVKEYQDLRLQVETEVGRINGRFTEPGHDVPVHYLYRSVPREKLAAYYRLADVMCVTPLKDGMNLVAKEFVTCQSAGGESGVLLLSEFCGAILEFNSWAVRCNPFDTVGMSYLMEAALSLTAEDRRSRIQRMAAQVRQNDVYAWVERQLQDVELAVGRRQR